MPHGHGQDTSPNEHAHAKQLVEDDIARHGLSHGEEHAQPDKPPPAGVHENAPAPSFKKGPGGWRQEEDGNWIKVGADGRDSDGHE